VVVEQVLLDRVDPEVRRVLQEIHVSKVRKVPVLIYD
jgi:hypothetical protein